MALLAMSCGQNDTKKKELELKEKELALKEKELELKEKGSKPDTVTQISASPQTLNSSNTEEIILEIRAAVQKINSFSLSKKSFNANDYVTIDYYLHDNEIVKIIVREGTEHHYGTRELYYDAGKFIFSYYDRTDTPFDGPEINTKHRIYAKDDKIIRTMENKNITKSERKVLTPSSVEYKILKAYSSKNFEEVLVE